MVHLDSLSANRKKKTNEHKKLKRRHVRFYTYTILLKFILFIKTLRITPDIIHIF